MMRRQAQRMVEARSAEPILWTLGSSRQSEPVTTPPILEISRL
jgi:hypothetical protein